MQKALPNLNLSNSDGIYKTNCTNYVLQPISVFAKIAQIKDIAKTCFFLSDAAYFRIMGKNSANEGRTANKFALCRVPPIFASLAKISTKTVLS